MLGYLEYFKLPAGLLAVLVVILFAVQLVTDLLKLKGLAVPELLDRRERKRRKKREREALSKLPEFMDGFSGTAATLREVNVRLADFNSHYSTDNISQRNAWIQDVNQKLSQLYETQAGRDALMATLTEKIDKISIENDRSVILDFASKVINPNAPVARAEFERIIRIHKEYVDILEENNMTNGEVDIALRIIDEAYEDRLRSASFIEDVRGYSLKSR